MIIDCHGHFTTAPPALGQWRERQIRAFEESGARLPADELQISDDEIVTVIEQGQLKLQQERDTDVALFSPGAGKMAHHYGDEETSRVWSRVSNDLIARVCGLFPDTVRGRLPAPAVTGGRAGRLGPGAGSGASRNWTSSAACSTRTRRTGTGSRRR